MSGIYAIVVIVTCPIYLFVCVGQQRSILLVLPLLHNDEMTCDLTQSRVLLCVSLVWLRPVKRFTLLNDWLID